MRYLKLQFDDIVISRHYNLNDPIWGMPKEKQERQLIADVQKDLTVEADRRCTHEPYQTRG